MPHCVKPWIARVPIIPQIYPEILKASFSITWSDNLIATYVFSHILSQCLHILTHNTHTCTKRRWKRKMCGLYSSCTGFSTLLLYRERWRWIIDGLSPARQEKAFWRNGTFPVVKKVCNLSIWTNKITWPLNQVTWPTVFKCFRQQNMKENDLCFFSRKKFVKVTVPKMSLNCVFFVLACLVIQTNKSHSSKLFEVKYLWTFLRKNINLLLSSQVDGNRTKLAATCMIRAKHAYDEELPILSFSANIGKLSFAKFYFSKSFSFSDLSCYPAWCSPLTKVPGNTMTFISKTQTSQIWANIG